METLSQRIYSLAKEVNVHCNGIQYYVDKDQEQLNVARSFFSSAISDFYNFVHQNGGKSLVRCETQYLKEVGLAYIKIAHYYQASSQDWYVNSVSAENAYYCLVRYYMETDDSSSLPFLFLLFNENKSLFDDKFKQSWQSINQELIGIPYGAYSLSADVELSACVRYYHIYVQYYMLSKFYDLLNKRILVKDKILDLYYPNFADIICDFINKYTHYNNDEYACNRDQLGRIYFNQVFKQCELALVNF